MIVCYYHTGFRQIYFPLWKCFRNLTANTFEPQLPRLLPRRPTKVLPKLRLWQLFLQLFGQTKGNRKIGGVDPPTFGQRYGWARVKATFVPATSFLSDFPLPLSWLAKWLKFQGRDLTWNKILYLTRLLRLLNIKTKFVILTFQNI